MNTATRCGKESTFFFFYSFYVFFLNLEKCVEWFYQVDLTQALAGELARKRIVGWEAQTESSLGVSSGAGHLILLI